MNWARKGVVHFLAGVLLITLLITAYSASFDQNLTKPAKIETWLQQSNLYGHFVSFTIDQSKKSVGSSGQLSSISLSDSAVQQAAENAFSPSLIQQDINTFINSNYAWLQGKTATPEFKIDLTAAKESFGSQVGQYVTAYFNGLPVCTAGQLAQLQSIDPLTAPCRPGNISAAQEGLAAEQEITSTTDFLSNPVLTAQSINPNKANSSQPYYQRFSSLPKLYRLATRLPLITGVIALLSILGIILLHPSRRKGLRRIGIIFVAAGVIMIIGKLVSNALLKRAENSVFNTSNVGQLQQALTTFANKATAALSKSDLYFGIAFLIVGLIIVIALLVTRKRLPKLLNVDPNEMATEPTPSAAATLTSDTLPVLSPTLNQRPAIDIAPQPAPKPSAPLAPRASKSEAPAPNPSARQPKPRRRLIQ